MLRAPRGWKPENDGQPVVSDWERELARRLAHERHWHGRLEAEIRAEQESAIVRWRQTRGTRGR
jgi:hypothetical protein